MVEDFRLANVSKRFFFDQLSTYHSLAICYIKFLNLETAIPCLFQALEMAIEDDSHVEKNKLQKRLEEKTVLSKRNIRIFPDILYDIRLCYMKQNQF